MALSYNFIDVVCPIAYKAHKTDFIFNIFIPYEMVEEKEKKIDKEKLI